MSAPVIVPSAEQIRQRLYKAVEGVIRYRQHLTGCDIDKTDFCSCGLRESMDDLHETWKSSFTLLDTLSQELERLKQESVKHTVESLELINQHHAALTALREERAQDQRQTDTAVSDDQPENITDNPKSWIAWKRHSQELEKQIAHLTEERNQANARAFDLAAQLSFVAGTDTPNTERAARAQLVKRLAALTEVHERLMVALKAAEQFIWPEISRGPAINGWQNTVDMVQALLSPREGTLQPKYHPPPIPTEQDLKEALARIAGLDFAQNGGERPPLVVAVQRWNECVTIAKQALQPQPEPPRGYPSHDRGCVCEPCQQARAVAQKLA